MIKWSIDTQDYIWATGEQPQPEKQSDAVAQDLDKGGNLLSSHFLSVAHSPLILAERVTDTWSY